jgi:hypothetical protein
MRSIGATEVGRSRIGYFQVIPRGRRATPHLRALRTASARFKLKLADRDEEGAEAASERAWNALSSLFDILRNEQDQQHLADQFMAEETGYLVKNVSSAEREAMIAAARIDRSHPGFAKIGLRDVLNKIAHHDTRAATFRVDGRGAHYLLLGGEDQKKRRWVMQVLVTRLYKNASRAVAAIK